MLRFELELKIIKMIFSQGLKIMREYIITHLTEADRIKIKHYLNVGYSCRKITTLLNVNVSTI